MPFDVAARILENRSLGGNYFLTTFLSPEIAEHARPGQFVMAGARDPLDLLLRRPFSVCLRGRGAGSGFETVSLLYRVTGRGTAFLSRLSVRDDAALLGPLGCGFTEPRPEEQPVIVAGGIGVAAFPFLAEELLTAGCRPRLLYGGRTAADLPMLDWWRARIVALEVTTDDGSAGERGLVTEPLERLLRAHDGPARVYACGPTPMMRSVAEIAAVHGTPCEVALETPMACGYGVCVGCVVEARTSDGAYGRYRRVCVDGPVFDAAGILW